MFHCNKIFCNGNRFVSIYINATYIMHDCNKFYCHVNCFVARYYTATKYWWMWIKGRFLTTPIAFVVAKELPKYKLLHWYEINSSFKMWMPMYTAQKNFNWISKKNILFLTTFTTKVFYNLSCVGLGHSLFVIVELLDLTMHII